MRDTFLDYNQLDSLAPETFRSTLPFPWHSFDKLLTPERFQKLNDEFPSLALFERHEGVERPHRQRPQNRYYLGYEGSIYHEDDEASSGVASKSDLGPSWQAFLDEIHGEDYRRFISSCLDGEEFLIRCTWHLGFTGSDVCPHTDAKGKIATHIFYFNSEDQWDRSWGGAILLLSDKKTDGLNPDFDDFGANQAVETLGNSSFFFKNTPAAWHGVRPLNCPDGAYRKLFNVVFESPRHYEKPTRGLAKLRQRAQSLLKS